jgi:HK97 family phage major capsid protein
MEGITVKLIDGNHGAGAVAAAGGHNTLAEIDSDDLTNVMAAVPQYALRGSKWYCSPVAWALIFEPLLMAGGGNTIQNLADGSPMRFLGYPVVVTPSLPTSTGDLATEVVLLFGNMRQAVAMGDRRQIRLMLSEHRYYELDQIGLRGTERFDINVHDLGDGTTAGPLVGLVATA